MSTILHAMAPLWFLRTSRSLAFSVADSAEEITTRSWLSSCRKAYSRCSSSSFSSSLGGLTLEGFNCFSGAFHSSGSTSSSATEGRRKDTGPFYASAESRFLLRFSVSIQSLVVGRRCYPLLSDERFHL
ncbi:hypothetical protein Tco_0327379 [Tanacetum coccineum]